MGEGHKKLNFSDCMGLAIGQIIGSGIMVLTGIVIGLTGHGIAAAFILGAVLAIITCVPFIILTSAIPSSGAGFTYIRRLMGEKAGFMYIAMFVLSQVLIATYAKGFASYFCSIFPQFGESAVAMAALVICTAVNLIGLKSSALVQKGMVVLLLLSLFLFIVFGLPKVSWDALTPTVSNLMPNGPKNFFTGVALLSFACGGANSLRRTETILWSVPHNSKGYRAFHEYRCCILCADRYRGRRRASGRNGCISESDACRTGDFSNLAVPVFRVRWCCICTAHHPEWNLELGDARTAGGRKTGLAARKNCEGE